ncbi:MAG: AI-2E family transporter [Planctomycetales bacterium]|nr:AI-2E family transporter [bacterium]UNM07989.1 MAG: AI-2E family transporter [Planctomycetales bacterium]
MPSKTGQYFRNGAAAAAGVVLVLVGVYVLYLLRNVAMIVLIAGLLAYVVNWLVGKLSSRMPRIAAVWASMAVFMVLMLGVFGTTLPVISGQVSEFSSSLGYMIERLDVQISGWSIPFVSLGDNTISNYLDTIGSEWQKSTPQIISATQNLLSSTASLLATILIIPLITLYLLLDGERLRNSFIVSFPERNRQTIDRVMSAISRALGNYIYSRLVLGLFVGVMTTIILGLFGIKFALLLGLLAFFGEFIPVIGPWLAYLPTALIVMTGEPTTAFITLLVVSLFYLVVQMIENYIIVPKLMADTMDMHPLTVILAIMIGGTLGGIPGLFVSIPVAAMIKVLLKIFYFRMAEPGIEVPEELGMERELSAAADTTEAL